MLAELHRSIEGAHMFETSAIVLACGLLFVLKVTAAEPSTWISRSCVTSVIVYSTPVLCLQLHSCPIQDAVQKIRLRSYRE
jgi:hypothetical protein